MKKNFKYKATFGSVVRCVIDAEKDKLLSQASLDNLKGIIPENVKNQDDLLPISFNSCTPNLGNKNSDVIDTKTALAIYKSFINKPLNIEHRRAASFGHIVNSAFSKYDLNYAIGAGSEILTEEQVSKMDGPFNIALSGVVYKLYSEKLAEAIEASNDPESPNYLEISASWELWFDDYVIALGSKYLKDCKIINDKDKIEEYSKFLVSEGGSGKLEDGTPVYRLLVGEVLPLGIGLTLNPAGDVKGILVGKEEDKIEENNNKETKIEETNKESEILASQTNNKTVKDSDNKNFMKITTIKDINDENLKEAKASDVTSVIEKEVTRIASEWEEKNKAEKNKTIEAENKSKETEAKFKELESAKDALAKELDSEKKNNQDKFSKLEEKYNQLVKANQDRENEQTFSARMNSIDSEYELDKDEKEIVASEIKNLDEEGFKAYAKKMTVLFKSKKKAAKKADDKEDAADKGADENSEAKKCKASTENAEKTLDKALENADKEKAKIANATGGTESLADKTKKAFGIENWQPSLRTKRN